MRNCIEPTDHGGARVFLFLQSHPSTFARRLADELDRRGHKALRINLCAGDALYWLGKKATNYRGRQHNWREFLRDYILSNGVTDLLYYGDRRPYHVIAAHLASKMGINAFTYEFGYLRPDWITLERGGSSAYSHFPDDPDLIREIAETYDAPDMRGRFNYTKAGELFHEVRYNLVNFFAHVLYPFYDADKYYNTILEYVSGIPGLITEGREKRRARAMVDMIISEKQPFFLFPLQLQCDYQLRCNAPFAHQKDAIELVLRSFARHAVADARLIIKEHPLDNGWEGWRHIVASLAKQYCIADRVHVIKGGDLQLLLKNARGCVLINSTVGLHALQVGCPVKPLGTALYDIEGLCHRGSLHQFWTSPMAPDSSLVLALVRALAGSIQVKGNFFTSRGQAAAVPRMAQMLIDGTVNGSGAYVEPAPRLERLYSDRMRVRAEVGNMVAPAGANVRGAAGTSSE
jgi:capsular polysaccharide export protein